MDILYLQVERCGQKLCTHMASLFPVFRRLPLPVAILVATLGGPAFAAAQNAAPPAGADVEVRNVKFGTMRPPGGGDAWLETTIEVGVIANPAAGAYGRFADRVRATLLLSLRGRDQGFVFYRASAEAVTLETGRAAFRFYLPPEVLRREQVNTDPYAYAVELSIQGRALEPGAGAMSASLRTTDPQRMAEIVRTFKDRVAQSAPLNDGVMVPQYLSPFALSYGGDTPSFVRPER